MNRMKIFACLALLLFLAACGTTVVTSVPLKPAALSRMPDEKLACRVALVADPGIRQVKALRKEMIGPDVEYVVTTMPNFYMGVLAAHFEEVEIVEPGGDLEDFDLSARMESRKWEIQGAATTMSSLKVECDFLFTIEDVEKGRVIFTDEEKPVRWIPYSVPPPGTNWFVMHNREAVDAAFEGLSKKLGESGELKQACNPY